MQKLICSPYGRRILILFEESNSKARNSKVQSRYQGAAAKAGQMKHTHARNLVSKNSSSNSSSGSIRLLPWLAVSK